MSKRVIEIVDDEPLPLAKKQRLDEKFRTTTLFKCPVCDEELNALQVAGHLSACSLDLVKYSGVPAIPPAISPFVAKEKPPEQETKEEKKDESKLKFPMEQGYYNAPADAKRCQYQKCNAKQQGVNVNSSVFFRRKNAVLHFCKPGHCELHEGTALTQLNEFVGTTLDFDDEAEQKCKTCGKEVIPKLMVTGKNGVPEFFYCSAKCAHTYFKTMKAGTWKALANPKGDNNPSAPTQAAMGRKK
jgi:hypothetical protein